MVYMAVDYGDRRTGIALSDLTGTISGNAWSVTESNAERLIDTILASAEEQNVRMIIVGLPRNMDGSTGPRALRSMEFADQLQSRTDIPVKMWDERLTTVDAHRLLHMSGKKEKKHRKVVDAVAATLILQSYLDHIPAEKEQ